MMRLTSSAIKLIAAITVLLPTIVIAAPKTDVLIFKNGDRLTGELKSMERGRIRFNTDATGTISIEWKDVQSLQSNQNVQLETDTGARFFGHLVPAEEGAQMVVQTPNGPQEVNNRRVIKMSPIEGRGLAAFDLDITFGYNFAKANGIQSGTLGFDAAYRTQLRIFSFKGTTTNSDSDDSEASQRSNFTADYKRLLKNRWYYNGFITLDENDELGLDLRTSIGGGFGRFLIQNDRMLLTLQAGLLYSRENLAGELTDSESAEGLLAASWDWFLFDNPELDWSTTLAVYPNLSESNRVRSEFNTSLSWEIIDDLDWSLTYYSTYDSNPQSDTAQRNDYGYNTALTYSF